MPDLARAMIAAAGDRAVWNQVLHAPTSPAHTHRALVAAFAEAASRPAPKVVGIPSGLLRLVGLVNRDSRELAETIYQFEAPFVMSSAHSERLLGQRPAPLEQAAAETLAWWLDRETVIAG